jgi:hypothetical protein
MCSAEFAASAYTVDLIMPAFDGVQVSPLFVERKTPLPLVPAKI